MRHSPSEIPWGTKAQRGSTNRHCLLLGISCPQAGASSMCSFVHMPFTSQRLPPFPLLSLSSLPHHVTPAEGNQVNPACAKGRACQRRSCMLVLPAL